jgi:hypothetical protein
MRVSNLVAARVFCCIFLIGSGTVFGQAVYGSIFGTTIDQSGAAVVGATLTVVSVEKGTRFQTSSNATGNYELSHLIPDEYEIHAEAPGFEIFELKNVRVHADEAIHVDVELKVGVAKDVVSVSAQSVPLLKTDRADVATTFDHRVIEMLPLFNRNFTSIELLNPGAQQFMWQHASSENPQGGIQIAVNGQHFGGTAFQLDGTDNRDPLLGIIVINPTLESVTETKITSQNYARRIWSGVGCRRRYSDEIRHQRVA